MCNARRYMYFKVKSVHYKLRNVPCLRSALNISLDTPFFPRLFLHVGFYFGLWPSPRCTFWELSEGLQTSRLQICTQLLGTWFMFPGRLGMNKKSSRNVTILAEQSHILQNCARKYTSKTLEMMSHQKSSGGYQASWSSKEDVTLEQAQGWPTCLRLGLDLVLTSFNIFFWIQIWSLIPYLVIKNWP